MAIHLNCITKKTKTKTYKYFELASSYRDQKGVPRKTKLEYLGVLTEIQEAQWRARLAYFAHKNIDDLCLLNEIKSFENKHYLDVAILCEIYDSLNIASAFKYVAPLKDIDTAEVAKILIIARCLDPQANYRTVGWLENSFLPKLMDINSEKYNKDKISRELALIANRKTELQKIFLEYSKANNDGVNLYFFDGTSSYFEGTECLLSSPGMDKTSGFQDNMFTICLATDKKGVPIAWETSEGSKRDITEFKKVGKTLALEMGLNNVTFCFDRGVASQSNFDLIEQMLDSKFITGLNRNQIANVFDVDIFVTKTRSQLIETWNKKGKEEHKISRITPINGFYRRGEDRFYTELGIDSGSKRRHVASFNVNIFLAEQERRDNAIQIVSNQIALINAELKQAKGDRDYEALLKNVDKLISKHFLQKIVEIEIIPIAVTKSNGDQVQSHSIKLNINETQKLEQSKLDGILIYTTNHIEKNQGLYEVSAAHIVDHYADKYVIENAFRHLKSFLDLRPIFVRKEDHVRAHVDICMASYFIDNHIARELKKIDMSIGEFYSLIKRYAMATRIGKKDNHSIFALNQVSREVNKVLKALNVESVLDIKHLERHGIQH